MAAESVRSAAAVSAGSTSGSLAGSSSAMAVVTLGVSKPFGEVATSPSALAFDEAGI